MLYGVYQGIFRSVGKALAADFLPEELHASAIGWYTATVGLSGLVASVFGGVLGPIGPPVTFLFGAAFASLGGVATTCSFRDGPMSRKDHSVPLLRRLT